MTLNKYIMIGASTSALFLAACSQDTIADVDTSVNELETLHGDMVNEVNGLREEESALQDSFSETLETDESLSTLADGSSPVFTNIENRETHLANIEDLETQMSDHAEALTSYEGESLSPEQLESFAAEIDTFVGTLEAFREQYGQTLTTQTEYFENISAEDATYEIFSEGIQTINEQQTQIQETLVELDAAFVTFDDQLSELQNTIQDIQSESEGG